MLETKDFGQATDMVIAGKADALIGDEQIVLYHIFSHRLTKYVKKVGEPLYTGRNCMAGSKAQALLVSILNKGVEEARKLGVLDKINKKWLGTRLVPRETWGAPTFTGAFDCRMRHTAACRFGFGYGTSGCE